MKVKKVVKRSHLMRGGPYNGQILWLESQGTLTFTVHGQTGYYDVYDSWVPV
jgi:hypothetical protein